MPGSSTNDSNDTHKVGNNRDISRTAADSQCFVCSTIFMADEDEKHNLEREARGRLRNGTMKQESRIARDQEELNEGRIYMRNS